MWPFQKRTKRDAPRAKVGDVIRITDYAWEHYFQPILSFAPYNSPLAADYRALDGTYLVVEQLYPNRDHPPMFKLPSVGWTVIEHGWYEIVEWPRTTPSLERGGYMSTSL